MAGPIPRSYEQELLETAVLSDDAVAGAYREIWRVNDWLGNTRAILRLLRLEANSASGSAAMVLDIGCGHGAMLEAIHERLGLGVVGMDLRSAPLDSPVKIVTGNAVSDALPAADVAISLMTAHHLSEADLAGLIGNVSRSCRRLILLDLVRHRTPLALFRAFVAPWLCRVNAQDGATSIRRAYTVEEMRRIVDAALAEAGRPVASLRHTVAPLWTRQIVDIRWE